MENLLHLPQIRISILEDVISERKQRKNYNIKTPSVCQQASFIQGSKPYYFFIRHKSHKQHCNYLKCGCKNQSHPDIAKHQYLHRRDDDRQKWLKLGKCKTESCQIESQILNQTQRVIYKKQEHFRRNTQKEFTEFCSNKKKQKNTYSKFDKDGLKKNYINQALSTYNVGSGQAKKILQDKLGEMNRKRESNAEKNETSMMKSEKSIIEDKKVLQNKKDKNTNLNKTAQKSLQNVKNSQKPGNQKQSRQHKVQFYLQQPEPYKSPENEYEQQKSKKQMIDYVNNELNRYQNSNSQFFSDIANISSEEFTEKMARLRQMLEQNEQQGEIKKHIMENLYKVVKKIKQSNLEPEEKKKRIQEIRKLCKVSINLEVQEKEEGQKKQERDDVKSLYSMFKQKSKKAIKYNKSVKSIRQYLYQQCENLQQYDNEQTPKQKQQSKTSLFAMVDDSSNQNDRRMGSEQQMKKRMSSKVTSIRSNLVSLRNSIINETDEADQINEDLELTKQQIENNNTNTSNWSSRYSNNNNSINDSTKNGGQNQPGSKITIESIKHGSVKRSSKRVIVHSFENPFLNDAKIGTKDEKGLNPNSDNLNQQSVQEKEKNELLRIFEQNGGGSVFKFHHFNKMRKIKQRVKIERKAIQEFIQKNAETINSCKNILKKSNLQELIVQEKDSLLTKKKKLRRIAQVLQDQDHQDKRGKQEMMNELLKYIKIYQLECQLIVHKGRKKVSHQTQWNYIDENQNREGIDGLMENKIDDELKFIKLSTDYYYGQEDENEMNFTGPSYIMEQLNIKSPPIIDQKLSPTKVDEYVYKNFQNLLQKDIPETGCQQSARQPLMELILQSKEMAKVNKFVPQKLYNKIRKAIQQNKLQTTKLMKQSRLSMNATNLSLDLSYISKIKDIKDKEN